MPTQNVNLSAEQAAFIRESIGNGRYGNASEVVRAGLRLLEQSERLDRAKLVALKRLAKEGVAAIERGEYDVVGADDVNRFVQRLSRQPRKTHAR
jgi:antitoxin ParD1/3/4